MASFTRAGRRRRLLPRSNKKAGGKPHRLKNEPCTRRRLASPGVTRAVSSDRAPSRHTDAFAYRCFLPDLTGFTKVRCARPDRQRHLLGADPTETKPRAGIRPRCSGLRVQGTATSPSSTATLEGHATASAVSRRNRQRRQTHGFPAKDRALCRTILPALPAPCQGRTRPGTARRGRRTPPATRPAAAAPPSLSSWPPP